MRQFAIGAIAICGVAEDQRYLVIDGYKRRHSDQGDLLPTIYLRIGSSDGSVSRWRSRVLGSQRLSPRAENSISRTSPMYRVAQANDASPRVSCWEVGRMGGIPRTPFQK